jgi:hypothetical protein
MNSRSVLQTAEKLDAGSVAKPGTFIPAAFRSPSLGPRQLESAWQPAAVKSTAVKSGPGMQRMPGHPSTAHTGQEYPGHSFSRIAVGAGSGARLSSAQFGGGESPSDAVIGSDAAEVPAEAPASDAATTSESSTTPGVDPMTGSTATEAQPTLSWEHDKRSAHDALWWFNGEHPRWISTDATLVASGYSDPYDLNWRIVKGADKVAFDDAPTGPAVTVRSTAGSRRADDVEIEVSEGTGADAVAYTGKLTVRMPYRLILRSVNDSATLPSWASAPAGVAGWYTTIDYRIVDNVGGTIVGATVNENFPGSKTNDQPNNWVNPASFSTTPSWPNTNGTFIDNWFVWGGTPTPVAPSAANANQSVDRMTHEFYVGSTVSGRGVRVQTHTAHRYLGYARHESITTPAP